jgi:DNA primase
MAYSREIIERIKETARIEDYASRFTRLTRVGGRLKGLCPLHDEKTPSFTVNPEGGYFKCFGCGAGGDIFELRMKLENLTFHEALREFARECRIELKQTELDLEKMTRENLILRANKEALDFFRGNLSKRECAPIAGHLASRGYSDRVIEKFAVGASIPEDHGGWEALRNYLRGKGYDDRLQSEAGLLVHNQDKNSYYDRFRARLIFPIRSHTGRVVAFSGRAIEETGAKYVNTPETPVFTKGKHLYGLYEGKGDIAKRATAVLVEGYTDVLRFHDRGLPIALAGMGTAMTGEQARLIHRFAEKVVLAYDSDSAGREATVKNVRVLQAEGLDVRVMDIPEGEDPDSWLPKIELGELEERIGRASDHFTFMLNVLTAGGVPSILEERLRLFRSVMKNLPARGETVLYKDMISRAARATGLNLNQAEELIPNQVRRAVTRHRTRPKEITIGSQWSPEQEERLVLSLLLRFPEKENLTRFKSSLRPFMFRDPDHRELASMLMEISSPQKLASLADDPEIVEHETLNHLVADLRDDDRDGLKKDFPIFVERILQRSLESEASDLEMEISRAQDDKDDDRLIELMKKRGKVMAALNRLKSRFSIESDISSGP